MEKAFVYLGRDRRIASEVNHFSDKLNRAYLDLLGKDRYQELVRANEQFLTQDAYFEDVSQLERIGVKVPRNTPSKFIMATLSDKPQVVLDDLTKEILAAPAFYVSQESFRNSGSSQFTDRPIATYVHEFNHYLGFALQKVPMYMVSSLLAQKTGRQLTTDNLEGYLYGAIMDAAPVVEKQRRIALALTQGVLTNAYEQINGILDARILKSVGIEKKNEWRGQDKDYFMFPVPGVGSFAVPTTGDHFYGFNDRDVFERFMGWGKYFSFRGLEFRYDDSVSLLKEVNKLIETASKLNLKKVSLAGLDEVSKREEAAK